MNEDFVIEVSGLVKRFGEQTVLDGINLKIMHGETMVIMGGSGCGKSTLLRLMIGSLMPNAGSVKLFGKELSELNDDGLNEVRKQFGILFQSGALFNSMSVAENVALPMQEHTALDQNIRANSSDSAYDSPKISAARPFATRYAFNIPSMWSSACA